MLPRHAIRILSQLSTHLSKYKDQRLVLFNAGPSEGEGGGGVRGCDCTPFLLSAFAGLARLSRLAADLYKKNPTNPLLTGLVQCDFRRTTSSSALVSALGWDSLHTRRLLAQWSLFHRIHYKLVCVPFPQVITPATYFGRHDHTAKYAIPKATIDTYKFAMFPRTVRIWNRLPRPVSSMYCKSSYVQRGCTTPHQHDAASCWVPHMFLLHRHIYMRLHNHGTFPGTWHDWHPGIASKELRLGLLQQVQVSHRLINE